MRPGSLTVLRTFACAIIAVGTVRAAAQNPVPLPTDPAIAAYVSVTGHFLSENNQETKSQTLGAWAAAFAPNETFDFTALVGRAFLTVQLPDDDGWGGLFAPADANLAINVNVTDSQNRLGTVKVYENDSGRLVGTIQATGGGAQCQGTLQSDSAIRDYRMEIANPGGTLLSTLAVDLGKWDAVAWFQVAGGFEPFCPAPIASTHYTPQNGTDYYGTIGDPKAEPGVKSGSTTQDCRGCATIDVSNDTANGINQAPPQPYGGYIKRDVLPVTVDFGSIKFGDPAAATALATLIASLTVKDTALALSAPPFPPYCTGFGFWQISFHGVATAIMAVPFEQVRKGGLVNILLNAILPINPTSGFLSRLVKAKADDYLNNEQNRQQTKFKQGAVKALGDIYALPAEQVVGQARGLMPITTPVTFTIVPDIQPNGISYLGGNVNLGAAWTTPSPPGPAIAGPLSFNAQLTATKDLTKGYSYTTAVSMSGYEVTNQTFQCPPPGTISIPAHLTVLLQLVVHTRGEQNPMQAHVVLKNAQGAIIAQGDSSGGPSDYIWVKTMLAPGSYTLVVSAMWMQTQTVPVDVAIGARQDVTVTLQH